MKALNKQQILVLASEIHSELELEAYKYKQTEEYINFESTLKNDETYKELVKVAKVMSIAVDKGIYKDLAKWKHQEFTNAPTNYSNELRSEIFPKPSIPSKSTIENKIILATIDAEDLQSLITTVKESLNK